MVWFVPEVTWCVTQLLRGLNDQVTYRVLVSTDLGCDPDDIQPLVHLLHYSDILKIEGILSTTGPGSTPKAVYNQQMACGLSIGLEAALAVLRVTMKFEETSD